MGRTFMASITIRNLDDQVKARLRVRAAEHGRSMEDEVREILKTALASKPSATSDLASTIHERFRPFGGVELPVLQREPVREPPSFDP